MLKYFFNDIIENISAPKGFVTRIMVELESTIYDTNDVIID